MSAVSPSQSSTDSPLLAVKDLTVTYAGPSGRVPALRGLSFDLPRGRTLALVGESGSGKSTAALALGRLLPPPPLCEVSGEVGFDGRNLLALSERGWRAYRGRRLAWVFQEPAASLNPAFSIGEQIEEMLRVHRPDWADPRARALACLEAVGLDQPARRRRDRPDQFSGGQLQRILLAMALAPEPDLLIADEPTTALDVTLQARIFELLRDCRHRLHLTVILITHHLALVRGFADDLIVLRHGEAVERGPVDNVLAAPQHPYTRELLAAVPRLRHAPAAVDA